MRQKYSLENDFSFIGLGMNKTIPYIVIVGIITKINKTLNVSQKTKSYSLGFCFPKKTKSNIEMCF